MHGRCATVRASVIVVLLSACSSTSETRGGPRIPGDGGGAEMDAGPEDTGQHPVVDAGAPSSCLPTSTDCTSTPNACCSGICSVPTTIPGAHAFCAARCTAGSQCKSGCCAPEQNTGMMACAPRGFCSNTCSASGAACITPEDCCAGNTCVGTNGGSCAFICTKTTDCTSMCCAPLTNSTLSVCSARQFCP